MAFDRLLGEAYILMRADGRLIPRDVKASGEKAAKGWSKSFNKELKAADKGSVDQFRKSLAQATSDIDFRKFRKEFGTIDRTVEGVRVRLDRMREEGLLTNKAYKRVTATLNEWAVATTKVESRNKSLNQTMKDQTRNLDNLRKARRDEAAIIARSNAAYASYGRNIEFAATREQRALEDQNKAWLSYGRNVQHTLTANERLIQDQNTAWLTYGRNVEHTNTRTERALADQNKAWVTYGRNVQAANTHQLRWVRGARTLRTSIDHFTESTDHFGESIGRAFGKGSRNNFVNWIGSMVGGIARLGSAVLTFPFRAIAHIGDSFGTAFSASRALGAGKLLSVGRGLLSVFGGKGGIAGLIAGGALAAIGFGKVLPGLVSLLTQLGGVASALVGSISIGLVGALLAVTPAAIGAAAALGGVFGVIATFANDPKNKEFMDSIFTKPLKRLTKEFTPQIKTFLESIRSGFKRLLVDLEPSIGRFFDTFKKKMEDKSTQRALDAWSTTLGVIATQINDAVTSFGSGFIGFFKPVLPYAERLATWIKDIATRFDAWANSAKGQNAVADFMHNAWVNTKLVWDILKEIGSIIGTVFSSGDTTGQTFLTGIRDKLKEIDDFLKTPGGRKKLDAFFGDVKEVGKGIGEIALSVGEIIKNFNDPNARQSAKDMMDSLVKIGDAAEKVSQMADAIGRIIDYFNNPAMAFIKDVGGFLAGKGLLPGGSTPVPTPTAPTAPTLPFTGGSGPIPGPTVDAKLTVNGFSGTDAVERAMFQIGLNPKQLIELAGFKIPFTTDTKVYESTKRIIEQFKFSGKQVPVKGNEKEWNLVKGTIAGYAFKTKTVKIAVADQEVIDFVTKWNRVNLNKTATIRYAVVGKRPNGGRSTGGGSVADTATGGTFYGAQIRRIAEAGPEAVVPLRRPLSQVDPSVRALSAIAQGMKPPPPTAAGGVFGGGGTQVTVEAGAIQLVSPVTSPSAAARAVLNSLGDALATVG